jgi:excisionase family DNA binding protein
LISHPSILPARFADRVALSPGESAVATGLTRQTIYRLINDGKLRRFKVGTRSLIPVVDVLGLIGGGADAPTT